MTLGRASLRYTVSEPRKRVKLLLVGVCVEQKFVPKLNEISNNQASISAAAIKYSRLIFEGFKHHLNDDCTGVFLVPMGMYPESKVVCWKARQARGIYYLPFVNILILKQLSIALSLGYFTVKWCYANRKDKKRVVFTSIYLPFLAPFVILKWMPKLKLASFVPDLPEFEFSYTTTGLSIKRALVPVYVWLTNALCRLVDYYIFISDAMRFKFGERPYSVVEGFVDVDGARVEGQGGGKRNAIIYAGTLLEKFGIGNLVQAFLLLPGDYELWLFGSGDMEAEIRTAAEKDPRIKLWGHVPNKEVMEHERRATILVNPRFTANEFTKYSFPSKLLEYMASGRPVLTTRLESIPGDYDDKLYFIDDESVVGMRDALQRCLGKTDRELTEFGRRTQSYVLAEKNNVRRIAEVLDRLQRL